MRRVLFHSTRGLNLDDFIRCREETRRFRRCFADIREELLQTLASVKEPKP
jgi:hypothetical protein